MSIEYFYSAHSAFAYLGSKRLMAIANDAQSAIVHRPFNLDHVVETVGAGAFSQRSKAHIDYYFGREIKRWSEYRDAPVLDGIPTHHFNDMTLANCTLIAASEAGHDVDGLAHACLEAHWRDDADLADQETIERLVRSIGLDPDALIDAAGSDGIRRLYNQYTTEAIDRNVFGSPTYFVDGDMFYGQDRLELVERALRQPFQ